MKGGAGNRNGAGTESGRWVGVSGNAGRDNAGKGNAGRDNDGRKTAILVYITN